MQIIKIVILGIVQGLTEWLPISSTGHLRLFEVLIDFQVPILFDVILHGGTLIVVSVFFRQRIRKILLSLVTLDFNTEEGSLIPLIFVGVIPTVLIGVFFGGLIEEIFQYVTPIGVAFLFHGTVLYISKFGKETNKKIGYSTAMLMGVAQGIAIIPGVSRSGMTIAVALLLGIERRKAFEFSFLLSIPAILGALGYTVLTELGDLVSVGVRWEEILGGVLVSMLVGYLALKLLWKTLVKRKFHLFAFYCLTLGLLLIFVAGKPFGFSR
ncbi:MAG: undecaprenyl-diphosphate phosphatase [Candidatus Bathyarchaeota archaeon]